MKVVKTSSLRTGLYTLAALLQILWTIWLAVLIGYHLERFVNALVYPEEEMQHILHDSITSAPSYNETDEGNATIGQENLSFDRKYKEVISRYAYQILELLILVLLPLDLLVPQCLPTPTSRHHCSMFFNLATLTVAVGYAFSGGFMLLFIEADQVVGEIKDANISAQLDNQSTLDLKENETLKRYDQLRILIIQVLISSVFVASVLYLSIYNLNYRTTVKDQDEVEKFSSNQGNIHGFQLLLIAAATVLVSINEGIEVGLYEVVGVPEQPHLDEGYRTSVNASSGRAERFYTYYNTRTVVINDDDDVEVEERLSLEGNFDRHQHDLLGWSLDHLGNLQGVFIFTLLLLVQIRHYTFVHYDFFSINESRRRLTRFMEQYEMSPVERQLANSKECSHFCLDYMCSHSIYPRCSFDCWCPEMCEATLM